MTETEFDKIRAALKSAYPGFNICPDVYAIRLWYRSLKDLDYKLCETALLEIFATQKYPPAISDIREKCAECMMGSLPDAGEAWGEVQKAIRKYGSYNEPDAMRALSDTTRQAVKRMGFRELCMSDNAVADRAHFMKIFDAIAKREIQSAQVPPEVMEMKNQFVASLMKKDDDPEPAYEDKRLILSSAERAKPEYIDELMRSHGFKE